jgi:Chaperone of endosialidase
MQKLVFTCALLMCTTQLIWAQFSGTSLAGLIYREGDVAIGYPFPAGPGLTTNGAGLAVKGKQIAQIQSGTFGLFSDKWCGLGLAGPGSAYGLAIASDNRLGFYNLINNDLIAGFGSGNAAASNRFIIRSYDNAASGTSTFKDLLVGQAGGAVGINEDPLSTFWVNSRKDNFSLFKSIAIVGGQRFGPQGATTQVTSGSAIGTQANSSLASAGIAVEGMRAQLPSFEPTNPPAPFPGESVGVNLQVVKSPYNGPNAIAAIDAIGAFNASGTASYAELSWQDLDSQAAVTTDICPLGALTAQQDLSKFFISFRNGNAGTAFPGVGAFGTTNKLPVMTFQGNGRVGINTTQPTSGNFPCNPRNDIFLDVNGQAKANNFVISSDRRLKQDIKPINEAMQLVNKLQGTTYSYRQAEFPDRNFSGGNQYGFIAQDVEKVMPEAAFENSDGYYVMNYTMLIPVLTEAIKEKDTQLAALEAEVAELRSQFNDFKAAQQPSDLQGYELKQNAPNPFGQRTEIMYSVPAGVNNAVIRVYDLTGRMLRSFNASAGGGAVTIQAGDLTDGMYIYDLSVAGRQMIERKMTVVRN